jgi:hypothetical protein
LFVGMGGYPTIAGLQALVRELRPQYRFEVKYDIARFVPRK